MPFLRGEPACGGWDQGSSPARGTVQAPQAALAAQTDPAAQQPSPLVCVDRRCILGHSWPWQAFLALRIPIATHLAIRKKMHRLHLASRWDCPPVYFQGTWRCEAPSWAARAASCLLYPQQQQQQQKQARVGDSGERPPVRSLHNNHKPRSPRSQASSLFASPPHPHAIYPLVLAPPTPSF